MKIDGIYLEITGTFSFSINQSGLDLYNEQDKKYAIEDFWNEFQKSMAGEGDIDINFDWDSDKLQIGVGE